MQHKPQLITHRTCATSQFLSLRRLAVIAALLVSFVGPLARGAVIFHDGFEAAVLANQWSTTGTRDWRVTLSSEHGPASGEKHLIFDDSVDGGFFSVAEATVRLDLTLKRNVVLAFKAKSIGNEPHNPPTSTFTTTRSYDGVAISTDGGVNWRTVQSLAAVPLNYQSYSVALDPLVAALGGTYGSDVRIRFTGFDDAAVPTDGIAIDDVVVTAEQDFQSSIQVPSPVLEGSGPHTGTLLLSFTPETDTTLQVVAAPTGQLVLPASVVVPAGQTSATFQFTVADDSAVNLTRNITVRATGGAITTAKAATVTIYDDEAPTLALQVPTRLEEGWPGGSSTGTVTIDRAATQSLTLNLVANPAAQVSVSTNVTILAGQTQATFLISAQDDFALDGDVPVTISASAPGIATATAQTIATDNETRTISLELPPSIQEGRTEVAAVVLGGMVAQPLVVELFNSDSTSAGIPASVTIPAGGYRAQFAIVAHEDAATNGSRAVTLSAQAEAFRPASAVTTIRDNEVAGYVIATASDLVNPTAPVSFTVAAADREGNKIIDGGGTVNLEIVLPDGTTQPASPPSLVLTTTDTPGTVTLPSGLPTPLRLRATNAQALSGESQPFRYLRTLSVTAADLVWDPLRQRIYASVPVSAPAHANQVVAIDPATLQVVGSVSIAGNPGQLALTSGAEALYVACNGNGTITRIDPAAMSVVSTFPVGTTTVPSTVSDMAVLRGEPNLLVVGRQQQGGGSESLAVYDNGTMRPNTVWGVTQIEPSADPGVVFGPGIPAALVRYKVNSNGIAAETSATSNGGGPMVADQNIIATRYGPLIDGSALRTVGSFLPPQTYDRPAVRPEVAANRVYFVEPVASSTPTYNKVTAYDMSTFAPARQVTMPAVSTAESLIRWGASGMAFRTSDKIVVLDGADLVPHAVPAELAVTVTAGVVSANVGAPLVYTVQLTNSGPNVARAPVLTAKLSPGQLVQSVTSTSGTPSVAQSVATLRPGDLAAGASVQLTITVTTVAAGTASCSAAASSQSRDSNAHNDVGFKSVQVGYDGGLDRVNRIAINANNLVYDAFRNVIWATIPHSAADPLSRSLVAIHPQTGVISERYPLSGNPQTRCMSLSPNGRYLYIGRAEVSEVIRIDLHAGQYSPVQIPLGDIDGSRPHYAGDLEVLEGDGRSFIATARDNGGVAVFDGAVRRPNKLGIYTADRIERSPTPDVFIGMTTGQSPSSVRRLVVSPSGVSVAATVQDLLYGADFHGSGTLLFSGRGQLADINTLARKHAFGFPAATGWLDAFAGRAFLVYNKQVRAFDTTTGSTADTLELPTNQNYSWAVQATGWASDGFAIAGPDELYLGRWSATTPPPHDQNGDQISDAWAIAHFGTISISIGGDADGDGIANAFEYLFGSSPLQSGRNPVEVGFGDGPAGRLLRLTYPRRAVVPPTSYRYERSLDLRQWTDAVGVSESVIGTQTVNGFEVHTIRAEFPASDAAQLFGRLGWGRP
jgi:uncharacterized repeat protein (TIGR01451 family)